MAVEELEDAIDDPRRIDALRLELLHDVEELATRGWQAWWWLLSAVGVGVQRRGAKAAGRGAVRARAACTRAERAAGAEGA